MKDLYQPTFLTLNNAIGTIQAGPLQQERLDEITERLTTDEFYRAVEETIPSKCIDGRTGALGYAPNAAGGTETLLVADDLTAKRFEDGDDSSTAGEYGNVLTALSDKGLPIGGHTDDHAHGDASGCGANDKLGAVYGFISDHGDVLRELTETLGVRVSNAAHALITQNARARSEFSPGAELLARLRASGGNDVVDPLHGDHKEVVAVINTKTGTTLDRDALEAEFGNQYEAFNVDAWSFPAAAEAISEPGTDITPAVVAMTYYNLAVAHVLCGKNMRVIVR